MPSGHKIYKPILASADHTQHLDSKINGEHKRAASHQFNSNQIRSLSGDHNTGPRPFGHHLATARRTPGQLIRNSAFQPSASHLCHLVPVRNYLGSCYGYRLISSLRNFNQHRSQSRETPQRPSTRPNYGDSYGRETNNSSPGPYDPIPAIGSKASLHHHISIHTGRRQGQQHDILCKPREAPDKARDQKTEKIARHWPNGGQCLGRSDIEAAFHITGASKA
ncbi:hypothetical protein Nepgr_034009 [Nepenthes gracilis]|uniref:Uncharacterized protein n=1 Tax=Nepenthes gracilis TaxID=150966 RepID=A0AAD3TLG1_NEPGR|nr:hypothetical protein Nepgr_034009 [Nepenthes gracilis]